MRMSPKFSIVIPVYNCSHYLKDAVNSSLRQSEHDFEIIISDNCSTEDLKAVADSFRDSRIKYSRSDIPLGVGKNHQRAVTLSQGDYVVALHSDDMLLPNYLNVSSKVLDQFKEIAAVYSSLVYLSGSVISGYQPVPKVRLVDRQVYLKNPWLESNHSICPTCCLFRRSAFDKIGGYRSFLRFTYDWDIYLRFVANGGGVYFHPEVLAIYRKHKEQMAQKATLDGLYDVLDLWQLKEYSHWPSWKIADLTIMELRRSARQGISFFDIWRQVKQSGSTWRLLGGVGEAICRRMYSRIASKKVKPDNNFEAPINLEVASRDARELIGKIN